MHEREIRCDKCNDIVGKFFSSSGPTPTIICWACKETENAIAEAARNLPDQPTDGGTSK